MVEPGSRPRRIWHPVMGGRALSPLRPLPPQGPSPTAKGRYPTSHKLCPCSLNNNFIPAPVFNIIIIFFNFYLFIYLWLCWVFVSVRGLSLVVASGGHSSSRCAGLSLSRSLLLRSTGSRRAGSVIVAHGPSCSAACGIFPDKGSNPCPLHWQADSQPLRHQGSPCPCLHYLFPLLELQTHEAGEMGKADGEGRGNSV